jgi:hypothetical protein
VKPSPPAGVILRRSLLIWGWGQLSLGDRRGWLLLIAQPLAVAVVLGAIFALGDGTRWIIVFPLLALLLVVWVAQAIHAHGLAMRRGAAPGGEMQIAWAMPVVLVVFTVFWLVGGDHGSPSATLHEYVAAWRAGMPAAAAQLFVEPPADTQLGAAWTTQNEYIGQRVADAAREFGADSGLDPSRPHNGLRFTELADRRTADSSVVAVDIVRRQRVETSLFGLIPTATQQTVLVEHAGEVSLRSVPAEQPSWLPVGLPLAHVWRVVEVSLPIYDEPESPPS